MATAKIFRSRNSQAVQLPEEFRVSGKELEVFRRGDEIILQGKAAPMARAFELLPGLPGDLTIADRKNDQPQNAHRDEIKERG
jgi:antitoxin VapB